VAPILFFWVFVEELTSSSSGGSVGVLTGGTLANISTTNGAAHLTSSSQAVRAGGQLSHSSSSRNLHQAPCCAEVPLHLLMYMRSVAPSPHAQ
jgi:hypothetical protein